jgi:molybdenum cofactor cytidylyltransferase
MPKQLLKWGNKSFIKHIATTAIKSGLDPVIVVVGSSDDAIRKELADLPVIIVHNPNWNTGMSSSIKAGIKQIPAHHGGSIFLNADQPQTSELLIQKLIEEHRKTLAPIVAPEIDGQRGNPVLFDRNTFGQLMKIEGDIGGRAIFNKYPIQWVPWHDQVQLLDVDTPEEYHKFLEENDQGGN